tara:strand:- start:19511 stop:21163 length:1653 start_codon:yes stop_codon:yes gene_type:complete
MKLSKIVLAVVAVLVAFALFNLNDVSTGTTVSTDITVDTAAVSNVVAVDNSGFVTASTDSEAYSVPVDIATAFSSVAAIVRDGGYDGAGGLGSGWLVDVSPYGLSGCYMVTNSHVVNGVNRQTGVIDVNAGVKRVYVIFNTELENELKQVGVIVYDDPSADIAILRIKECTGLPRYKIVSDLRLGTPVFALGNPLSLMGSLTKGTVSKVLRTLPETGKSEVYVQTDTAINPGNSGGPLVDANTFKVVGMNVLGTRDAVGLNFAVHYKSLDQALKNLRTLGRPSAPVFGIALAKVNKDVSAALNVPSNLEMNCVGVYVSKVQDAAVTAGILAGDVMLSVNGKCINRNIDIVTISAHTNIWEPYDVRVWRSSTFQVLSLTLIPTEGYEAAIDQRADGQEVGRSYTGHLGFEVSSTTNQPTDKLVVTKVYEYSEAYWARALVTEKLKRSPFGIQATMVAVLEQPADGLGVDGKAVKVFQTIESVRDTNGRFLADISSASLENFAREAYESGADLVIEMKLNKFKAENYAATRWEEQESKTRFVVYKPAPYVAP